MTVVIVATAADILLLLLSLTASNSVVATEEEQEEQKDIESTWGVDKEEGNKLSCYDMQSHEKITSENCDGIGALGDSAAAEAPSSVKVFDLKVLRASIESSGENNQQ